MQIKIVSAQIKCNVNRAEPKEMNLIQFDRSDSIAAKWSLFRCRKPELMEKGQRNVSLTVHSDSLVKQRTNLNKY